jgi:pyruvate dehydrogenase E1 component alpha subunit
MLALGVSPNTVMAELCGKATGSSGGKGGSMHMYSKEHNFYGGCGIVGAQIPIGAGLAFAHRYKRDGGVSVSFFGDGAANQGQVYEAYNLASLWRLPAVFVLENNHYAMGTSEKRAASGENLKTRGNAFGIPTLLADGMDLFDMVSKSKEAIEHVRSGNGPVIIHADTYRYRGHSMSDPATYRTREEVDCMKKTRDPLDKVRRKLLDDFSIEPSILRTAENEIRGQVEEAAHFAMSSQWPQDSVLERDVIL